MNHLVRRALPLLLPLVFLIACNDPAATPTNEPDTLTRKPHVVATYSILGDLAQNVGGDAIELEVLVGPNGDAHTFEPTPAEVIKLAEADLVIENGIGFETWLDDLYASSESSAQRVIVTENFDLLEFDEHEMEGEDEAHTEMDGHEHSHGEFDPHVWHDVDNAVAMVEAVRDALAKTDPANAETYQANAEAYIAQLIDLDEWVRAQVETLSDSRRKLVTSHDTFSYFARAYGFEVVGTALGSISTEGGDPSAGEIAKLIEDIQAAGVPAIFAENVANPDLMQQIASEAGVTLAPPLYTDALGEPGAEGDTYIHLIRYNVETIIDALSQQ